MSNDNVPLSAEQFSSLSRKLTFTQRQGTLYKQLKNEFNAYDAIKNQGGIEAYSAAVKFQHTLTSYSNKHPDRTDFTKDLLNQTKVSLDLLNVTISDDLNFIWIGKLGGIQQDYIRAWAVSNPDSNINVWYDPKAFLSYELGSQIKKFATAQTINPTVTDPDVFESDLLKNITQLQDNAHKYITAQRTLGVSYDDAAKAFLVEQLNVDGARLDTILTDNKASFENFQTELKALRPNDPDTVGLKSIDDLWDSANGVNPEITKYYQQELSLRGNLASASDLARYELLRQHGGIYLDADILPSLNKDVFAGIDIPKKISNDAIIKTQLITEYLSQQSGEQIFIHRGLLSDKTADYDNKIADARSDYPDYVMQLEAAIKNHGSKPLFESLPEIKIIPDSTLAGTTGNRLHNAVIGAIQDSKSLTLIQNELIKRYQYIESQGYHHAGNSDDFHARSVRSNTDFLNVDGANASYSLLARYRTDGLVAGSASTIYLSGPTLLTDGIDQFNNQFFENKTYLKDINIYRKAFYDLFSEEERLNTWKAKGDTGRPINYYAESSSYTDQVIIQLGDSIAEQSSAKFLYNKHANDTNFSRWLKLDAQGQLIDVISGQAFKQLGANSRIIVVGHGSGDNASFVLSGKSAVEIASLLKTANVGLADDIARISLVGCGCDYGGGGFDVDHFSRALFTELETGNVNIGSISGRNALVQVDALGRKWTGVVQNNQILWTQDNEPQKIIVKRNETGELISNRVPVSDQAVYSVDVPYGSSGTLIEHPNVRRIIVDILNQKTLSASDIALVQRLQLQTNGASDDSLIRTLLAPAADGFNLNSEIFSQLANERVNYFTRSGEDFTQLKAAFDDFDTARQIGGVNALVAADALLNTAIEFGQQNPNFTEFTSVIIDSTNAYFGTARALIGEYFTEADLAFDLPDIVVTQPDGPTNKPIGIINPDNVDSTVLLRDQAAIDGSGLPRRVIEAWQKIARDNNTLIAIRPVNSEATDLIDIGLGDGIEIGTKGLNVKGKSSPFGLQAGLIPFDAELSKSVLKKDGGVEVIRGNENNIKSLIDANIDAVHLNLDLAAIQRRQASGLIDAGSLEPDSNGVIHVTSTQTIDGQKIVFNYEVTPTENGLYSVAWKSEGYAAQSGDASFSEYRDLKVIAEHGKLLTADADLFGLFRQASDVANLTDFNRIAALSVDTDGGSPSTALQRWRKAIAQVQNGLGQQQRTVFDPETGRTTTYQRSLIDELNAVTNVKLVNHGTEQDNTLFPERDYNILFIDPEGRVFQTTDFDQIPGLLKYYELNEGFLTYTNRAYNDEAKGPRYHGDLTLDDYGSKKKIDFDTVFSQAEIDAAIANANRRANANSRQSADFEYNAILQEVSRWQGSADLETSFLDFRRNYNSETYLSLSQDLDVDGLKQYFVDNFRELSVAESGALARLINELESAIENTDVGSNPNISKENRTALASDLQQLRSDALGSELPPIAGDSRIPTSLEQALINKTTFTSDTPSLNTQLRFGNRTDGTVGAYQQRVDLFYAYRQVLVEQGVIGAIGEKAAFELGSNSLSDYIKAAEADGNISQAALAELKAINSAFSETGEIKLNSDTTAIIENDDFNLPTSDHLTQVRADAVHDNLLRARQLERVDIALRERLSKAPFDFDGIDLSNASAVSQAIMNGINERLGHDTVSQVDLQDIQLGLKLRSVISDIEQYRRTGETSPLVSDVLLASDSQSDVSNRFNNGLDFDGLNTQLSKDGKVGAFLSIDNDSNTLSIIFSTQDSSQSGTLTRKVKLDLSSDIDSGQLLTNAFDSLKVSLDKVSIRGISVDGVDLTQDNANLGLNAIGDLDTRIAQGISDGQFRNGVLDNVLNTELLKLQTDVLLNPDNLDFETALDKSLSAFERIGLPEEAVDGLRKGFQQDADFQRLVNPDADLDAAVSAGTNYFDKNALRNDSIANQLAILNNQSELSFSQKIKKSNLSLTQKARTTGVGTAFDNANTSISKIRTNAVYSNFLTGANSILGVNGLVNIARSIDSFDDNYNQLSETDRGITGTQISLGLAGVTTGAAQIGLNIGTSVAEGIFKATGQTGTIARIAKDASKVTSSLGEFVPYAGMVIGTLASFFSIGTNIKDAVNAGKAGNSAQVGFFAGLAVLDTIDLVVSTLGNFAEYIPVIGNIIGFIADVLSLLIGILSQFIGQLIPDPNAQQNFDSLVSSDGFTSFLEELGDSYAEEGYDVLEYQTDAARQGVDNPYNDDTTEITNEYEQQLSAAAERNPENPYLRIASIDDTLSGNTLEGRLNDDYLDGRAGDDILNGYAGDDRLFAGSGNDTVNAGLGDDIVQGGSGNDVLKGGAGDDLLDPGTGVDFVDGGEGVDTISYRSLNPGFLSSEKLNKETVADAEFHLEIDLERNQANVVSNHDGQQVNLDEYFEQHFGDRTYVMGSLDRLGSTASDSKSFNTNQFGNSALGYSDFVTGSSALNRFNQIERGDTKFIKLTGFKFGFGGQKVSYVHTAANSYNFSNQQEISRNAKLINDQYTGVVHGASGNAHRTHSEDWIVSNLFGNDALLKQVTDQNILHSASIKTDVSVISQKASFLTGDDIEIEYNSVLSSELFEGNLFVDPQTGDLHFLNNNQNIYFKIDADDLYQLSERFGGQSKDLLTLSELVRTKTLLTLADDVLVSALESIFVTNFDRDSSSRKRNVGNTLKLFISETSGNDTEKKVLTLITQLRNNDSRFNDYSGDSLEKTLVIGLRNFLNDVVVKEKIRSTNETSLDTKVLREIIFDSADTSIVSELNSTIENVIGSAFSDKITGDSGDNSISGAGGGDDISGGEGRDTISGNQGSDILRGGKGNDTLYGDEGDDSLYGGENNDILDGGAGQDHVDGGSGVDTLSFASENHGVHFSLSKAENFERGVYNIENVIGSEQSDYLEGDENSNVISGGEGDDILKGGGGSDFLDGGKGNDEIDGGEGIDTISFTSRNSPTSNSRVSFITHAEERGGAGSTQLNSNKIIDNPSMSYLEVAEGTRNAVATLRGSSNQNNFGIETLDLRRLNEPLRFVKDNNGDVLLQAVDVNGLNPELVVRFKITGKKITQTNFENAIKQVLLSNNRRLVTGKNFWSSDVESGVNLFEIQGATIDLSDEANQEAGVRNVENILGSAISDTLVGDDKKNRIDGAGGLDSISAGGGDDIIVSQGGEVDGGTHVEGSQYGDTLVLGIPTLSEAEKLRLRDIDLETLSLQNDFIAEDWADINSIAAGKYRLDVDLRTRPEEQGLRAGLIWATNIETVYGNDWSNRIYGNEENNIFIDGLGADILKGFGGNDTLVAVGDAHRDILEGGQGDDTLISQGRDEKKLGKNLHVEYDILRGGEGNDLFILGRDGQNGTGSEIYGGADVDTASFQNQKHAVTVIATEFKWDRGAWKQYQTPINGFKVSQSGARLYDVENIIGTDIESEGDVITGDANNNFLDGRAGDDQLSGGSGHDVLQGGAGRDELRGGTGDDTLIVDLNDTVIDGGENSEIRTQQYDDFDTVQINETADLTVRINDASATISDGTRSIEAINAERIATGTGDDILLGDGYDNQLAGGVGDDVLHGYSGKDVLDGGLGTNMLFGGSGDDILVVDLQDGDVDSMLARAGDENLTVYQRELKAAQAQKSQGINVLHGGSDQDTARIKTSQDLNINLKQGTASHNLQLNSIEHLIGGSGDDHFVGDDNANQLQGGSGADILEGGKGDDRLIGGAGSDTLIGGEGQDTADFVDYVSEDNQTGITVNLNASTTTDNDTLEDIENISGSRFNDRLVGDEKENRIFGGAGNDRIEAGGGFDYLDGGAGTDFLDAGRGADTIVISDNDTAQALDGYDTYILSPNTENAVLNTSSVKNKLDLRAVEGELGVRKSSETQWTVYSSRNGEIVTVATINLEAGVEFASAFSHIYLKDGELTQLEIDQINETTVISQPYDGLNPVISHTQSSVLEGTSESDYIDAQHASVTVNAGLGDDTVIINGDDRVNFSDHGDKLIVKSDTLGAVINVTGFGSSSGLYANIQKLPQDRDYVLKTLDLRHLAGKVLRFIQIDGDWVLQTPPEGRASFVQEDVYTKPHLRATEILRIKAGGNFSFEFLAKKILLPDGGTYDFTVDRESSDYLYGINYKWDVESYYTGSSYQNRNVFQVVRDFEIVDEALDQNLDFGLTNLTGIAVKTNERIIIETTSSDDQIIATNQAEKLIGSEGIDAVGLRGGNDIYASHEQLAELLESNILTKEAIAELNLPSQLGSITVDGGAGSDVLISARSGDTLRGGDNEDFLISLHSNVDIEGGTGNDYLNVTNVGDRVIDGGSGIDTLDLSLSTGLTSSNGIPQGIKVVLNEVNASDEQTIFTALGYPVASSYDAYNRLFVFSQDGLYAASDAAVFTKTQNLSNIENVVGSDFDDILVGDYMANNTLSGGKGRDTLIGVAGNNTLIGGEGDDVITTGLGRDTVIVDSGIDSIETGLGNHTIIFKSGAQANIKYDAAAKRAESELYKDSSTLIFEDINFDDIEVTNFSGNYLQLNHGGIKVALILSTGFGHDDQAYRGPSRLIFADGKIVSDVETFLSKKIAGQYVEFDGLIASDSITQLVGNMSNNQLIGNELDNLLDGMQGANTLSGAGGDDRYKIHRNSSAETIIDSSGSDSVDLRDWDSSEIKLTRQYNDLMITEIATGSIVATVLNHFINDSAIEILQFNDDIISYNDTLLSSNLSDNLLMNTAVIREWSGSYQLDDLASQNILIEAGGTGLTGANLGAGNDVLVIGTNTSPNNIEQVQRDFGGANNDVFILTNEHAREFDIDGGQGYDRYLVNSNSHGRISDRRINLVFSDVSAGEFFQDQKIFFIDNEATKNGVILQSGLYRHTDDASNPYEKLIELDFANIGKILFNDGLQYSRADIKSFVKKGQDATILDQGIQTNQTGLITELVQAAASFSSSSDVTEGGSAEDSMLNSISKSLNWPTN